MAAERARRRAIAAVVAAIAVAVVVVALVSILGRDDTRREAAAAPSPTATMAVRATPTASPAPTPPPVAAEPAAPAPPATTAGPLHERNLPVAALIGRQWRAYADPGGPEAGFTGNGSWVRERNPSDVVDGLAPIGCTQESGPPGLPRPSAALEGTYEAAADGRDGGGQGVALALVYRSAAEAGAFMRRYAAVVAGCGAPPQAVRPDDPLTLVITPRTMRADLVVDTRKEFGVDASPLTWTEVVVRSGTRVALITIGTPPGAPPPDTGDLARALSTALPR